MGRIGSGKSTLAKLLVKLHDPDSGKILLNGVNYKNIKTNNIRNNIIYIPQMPILLKIWDNITYGFLKIQLKRVADILDKMGLSKREYF